MYGADMVPEPIGEWIGETEATFVVNPPAALLADVVDAAMAAEAGSVRALVTADAATTLSEDFLLETRLAEARARERLAARVVEDPLDDRLLLNDGTARVLVPVAETVGVFETDADSIVDDLRAKYESRWDDGDRLRTRAPPRTDLFETAADHLSDAFVSDLRGVLDGAEDLDWHGSPTPIEVALVVAARASEHLYDVSRWGEDAEFASRSSLSRAKNCLEEVGVLSITRDPQKRGRPRQRLQVGDERLAEADPQTVVPALRSVLADGEG